MSNISLSFEEEEELFIKCQKVQISQVFLNLISNSVDEIKDKEGSWIKVKLKNLDNKIQIRVEDSGSGIPIEIQNKMFLPFFTTKDVGSGTGIGLSISTGIVNSHNGKLYVDNEVKNTCIVLELPKEQGIS